MECGGLAAAFHTDQSRVVRHRAAIIAYHMESIAFSSTNN
jgi:hypothetical protein